MTTLKTISADEVRYFFLWTSSEGWLGGDLIDSVRNLESVDDLNEDFIRKQLLSRKSVPKYLEAFDLNQSGKAFWQAAYRWILVLTDMASDVGEVYAEAMEQGKTEEEAGKLIDAAVENYQPTR